MHVVDCSTIWPSRTNRKYPARTVATLLRDAYRRRVSQLVRASILICRPPRPGGIGCIDKDGKLMKDVLRTMGRMRGEQTERTYAAKLIAL